MILGFGVALYFVSKDGFYLKELKEIEWQKHSLIWLIASVLMMVLRDLGYIWRLRILSEKELSWKQCFQIIVLWEFSSSISPGAIGGTAAAVVIMAQEHLRSGLTTAIVLVTSFLDELFYILSVPLIVIFIGLNSLIPEFHNETFQSVVNAGNLKIFFLGGYIFLFLWTLFLAITLFIKPEFSKRIIVSVLKFRPFRRFRRRGQKLADDLVISSRELRDKGMKFWYRAFAATILTWTARFLVVNCLIMIFVSTDQHVIIYGRQLVMWVILLIAITPGGSGVAELLFTAFLGNFLPSGSIARLVSILWRLISYYPYILLGFIILPIWEKRVGLYEKIKRRIPKIRKDRLTET